MSWENVKSQVCRNLLFKIKWNMIRIIETARKDGNASRLTRRLSGWEKILCCTLGLTPPLLFAFSSVVRFMPTPCPLGIIINNMMWESCTVDIRKSQGLDISNFRSSLRGGALLWHCGCGQDNGGDMPLGDLIWCFGLYLRRCWASANVITWVGVA